MDRVTPEQRSENMRRIRSQGMKPEITVRRLVHRMGFRYRLHRRELPGKPDLVFPGRRKIIFVHGCFWHQHPDPECPIAHKPRSNKAYWGPKFRRNVKRDAKNIELLHQQGWSVMVVWECEIKDSRALAKWLCDFLG